MILTGAQIHAEVTNGAIVIDPFDRELLNPNSYNFRLGSTLRVYTNDVLDPCEPQPTEEIKLDPGGTVLEPGRLYLGHSIERMGGDGYVGLIFARSSVARLGLFVQITAPLGDIGYVGQWTLQLAPTRAIRVYPEMRIGQILFILPYGHIDLYSGKYQGSSGPAPSQIYRDFDRRRAR